MPSLINFRGYTAPDPLDKGTTVKEFLILAVINMLLSALLIWLITTQKIVTFNGPTQTGFFAAPIITEIAEILINGFLFSYLIFILRKCSSIFPFLVVLVPYFLLDLYIESHYRATGQFSKALWNYPHESFVSDIHPAVLRFLVTLSADALIFGILSLFLARLVSAFIFSNRPFPEAPTKSAYYTLFKTEWSEEIVTRPKRDIAFWILRLLGVGYGLYLLILMLGILGPEAWPEVIANLIKSTYSNPVLAINTFFKITVMVMLTFTAAFNKGLRYYCCAGLFAGHLISTAYSLGFYYLEPPGTSDPSFLKLSGILDGSMVLIFGILMLCYWDRDNEFESKQDIPMDYSLVLTVQQWIYRMLGYFFIVLVTTIVLVRLYGSGAEGITAIFGYPDPLISNTVTFYGTLSVLFLMQVNREQLRNSLFNPLIIPLLSGSVLALVWITIGDLWGGVLITTRPPMVPVRADWYFVLEGVAGIIICITIIGLRRLFYSADHGLNSISPSTAISFVAIASSFFQSTEQQRTRMLRSIDNFIGGIRSRKRGLLNMPFALFENILNFFYNFHPPFSTMSRDEQRFYLHKYFLRDEWERKRAMVPPLADIAYQIGIALNTFVSFTQFNELNSRNQIGYVPVDARDRNQGDCAESPPPFKKAAALPKDHLDPSNYKPSSNCTDGSMLAPRLTTLVFEPEIPLEVEYVVIGSGAGGATAAYRLACEVKDPSQILVIESGNRYQPLQDFSDDEMDMFHKLYKEGGLQQTKKFSMTVAQGQCVGGSTIINNAVCFKMPDAIRKEWLEQFGLQLPGLDDAYNQIQGELHIAPLGIKGVNQTMRLVFDKAVMGFNSGLPIDQQLRLEDPVLVNHINNTGDGNWNIGNKRMQKRSMLETYLPWAEGQGVKIISGTTVAGFSKNGAKANKVFLRSSSGKITSVIVKKAIIIAGGAIASSQLLMESSIKKNTGNRLSCNFAFPLTLEFKEPINAFDGDQITMAALDPKLRAAFETYFNPPASFSITSIPFFYDKRDHMLKHYVNLANFGALIGSEPNGRVLPKATVMQGRAFDWQLGTIDRARIKYALQSLVQLGQYSGALKAFIPTKPGIALNLESLSDMSRFESALKDYPLRITDLYIGTAHPQGGNAMASSKSPMANVRVVNEDFRVNDLDNVFVADASLFPTSITVNPQWTIMALSTLAARSVLNLYP